MARRRSCRSLSPCRVRRSRGRGRRTDPCCGPSRSTVRSRSCPGSIAGSTSQARPAPRSHRPSGGEVTFAGTTPGNGLTLSIRTRRRLQRHADASRIAGDASRSKRGGGSDCRPCRRERPGGRRAVRPSRDPPCERRGRVPRSALVPPAEAGGVSPRAAGPSRRRTGWSPPTPQPAVAQTASAAAPAQEQPVLVQAAPAPPSSSGSPGAPPAAPPSAQPNEPVEPEPAPASSSPTIGTPDDGAVPQPQPAHHVTRGRVEPRAVAPPIVASRPRLQIESPQEAASNGRSHGRRSSSLRAHGGPPDAPAERDDSTGRNDARRSCRASAAGKPRR